MKRIVNALGKLNYGKRAYAVFVLCATTAAALPAQTFTTLYSFCSQSACADGDSPLAGLVQATNGDLYGTTSQGGANCAPNGCGTIFKISPGGTLTTLHSFDGADGQLPEAGLIQATNGDLYGTTEFGGAYNGGTVFKITPAGKLTTLYSFCSQSLCADGSMPVAGLVQATNGDLYGTTIFGGVDCPYQCAGTVFKITPSGALTTLYSFTYLDYANGIGPYGGLVQATNGYLYGTTVSGGYGIGGTVFKITPSGSLTTLYSLCPQGSLPCTDGYGPESTLVQATNGDLYGTTYEGGANCPSNGCGTVFKITPSGTLTTLYSFCSQLDCTDGSGLVAGLIQATDGNFYGTTEDYENDGGGTIFKITPRGKLTTIYAFCSQIGCADGWEPLAGLVQDTNGTFYGTTNFGGANDAGTVFSLSVRLGPFVETQTTSGPVGGAVNILGSDLTGATSVTFNSTPQPAFTVVSRYLITTTVPAGATTGTVQVVTPSRTLSSNVPFRVP